MIRCSYTYFTATHIEENHADESSDSSDGEEVDEGQGKKDNEHHNEGRKHKKVHRKDVSTRRTKSKSYWADMLKEVFEKYVFIAVRVCARPCIVFVDMLTVVVAGGLWPSGLALKLLVPLCCGLGSNPMTGSCKLLTAGCWFVPCNNQVLQLWKLTVIRFM